ncbi:GntR family transcriptional regulator, partial [Acinetobacter baumannii]
MSARPSRRTTAAAPRSATPAKAVAVVSAAAPAQAMALYEQVKDHIVRKIQEGIWRAGDRLPSENELVTQFGISR